MRRLLLLLILIAAAAATIPTVTTPAHAGSVASPLYFSHVVWIVMENHALNQLDAGSSATNGSLAYQLNIMNSSATAYNLGYESISGSLPNYLSMIAGSCSMASSCTCDSNPSVCGTFSNRNLVDNLEGAGLSWKGYMEGMPQSNICNNGGTTDGGTHYITHHNPFVYFSDIATDASRCQKVVPAGSYGGLVTCDTSSLQSTVAGTLTADLSNRTTSPNFMYVVPNNYDNTHDCPLEAAGNNWLKTIIPQILTSDTFIATPSAIVVTYDEATDSCLCEPIYTVWIGPQAQAQFAQKTPLCGVSSCSYNHYSILRTIEDNWGLSYLTSNDQNALSMGQFLYSFPTSGFFIDRAVSQNDAMCVSQSSGPTNTVSMPASTTGNILVVVIWASTTSVFAQTITDTMGILLSTITQRQQAGPNVLYEFDGFSSSKIAAGTISIGTSNTATHCSITVFYIAGLGPTAKVCPNPSLTTPSCVTSTGNTNAGADLVVSSCNCYTPGVGSSIEMALAIADDPTSFIAAENGLSCFMCQGEYNSTLFSSIEFNETVAGSAAPTVTNLHFHNYNGKGAGLSGDNTLVFSDGIVSISQPTPPPINCGNCNPVITTQNNNFAFNASNFRLGPFNVTLPYQLTQLQALELLILFPVAIALSTDVDVKKVPILAKFQRARVNTVLTAALTTAFDYAFHFTLTQPMEVPIYFVAKLIVAYVVARYLVPRLGIFLSAAVFTLSFDIYYAIGVLLHIPGLSSSPTQIIEIAGFGSTCLGYVRCDLGTEGALLFAWTFMHGLFFFAAAQIGKSGIPQPNDPIVLRPSDANRRTSLI